MVADLCFGLQATTGPQSSAHQGDEQVDVDTVGDEDVLEGTWDAILLPGGTTGTVNLWRSEKLVDMLWDSYQQSEAVIAASGASVVNVLLPKGLIDGVAVTTARDLAFKLPFQPSLKQRVVVSRPHGDEVFAKIVTSQGCGVSIEWALSTALQVCPKAQVLKVAKRLPCMEFVKANRAKNRTCK